MARAVREAERLDEPGRRKRSTIPIHTCACELWRFPKAFCVRTPMRSFRTLSSPSRMTRLHRS